VGRGRAATRGPSTSSRATRWQSTACWSHPDIKAVSFVGSTPIARYVYEGGTRNGKRVQALGGAKNHIGRAFPTRNLDIAADSAVNAGFGSAGERCMANLLLVAVEARRRRAHLQDPREDGAPSRSATGSVALTWAAVTRHTGTKVASYLDAGVAEGAELVVDGARPHRGDSAARKTKRPRRNRVRTTPTWTSDPGFLWRGATPADREGSTSAATVI